MKASYLRPLGCLLACGLAMAACGKQLVTLPAPASPTASGGQPAPKKPGLFWQEHFDGPLSWMTPLGQGPEKVARIYGVASEPGMSFLHARHDATGQSGDVPSVVHFGKGFDDDPPALERVRRLRWKWRVIQHPKVTDDPWVDLGASLYVIVKTPSLFAAGKGFKFGWVAAPAAKGTYQRGLLQVELTHEPATRQWKSEEIDVCSMFRQSFGPCEGEHLMYVGVMTDADGTKSIAEGDYADFELEVGSVTAN